MKKSLYFAKILRLSTIVFLILIVNFQSNVFCQTCYVPTNVTATPTTLSCGNSVTLNATATGNSIAWYLVPTGGAPFGTSSSGSNFVLVPSGTTIYWAEGFIGSSGSLTYSYTGSVQYFTVPSAVSSITVDVKGAQGFTNANSTVVGGLGGRVNATIPVTPSEVLNIYVGGGGSTVTITGGYNGGGSAGSPGYSYCGGGGGGGASDIRRTPYTYDTTHVLVVAGGGGGPGGDRIPTYGPGSGGGGGGGWFGGGGAGSYQGTGGGGGTQTAGGAAGTTGASGSGGLNGVSGTSGNGGAGGASPSNGQSTPTYTGSNGGVGGGLTGGTGGSAVSSTWTGGGGGGGSSYTNYTVTGVTHTQGYQSGSGQIIVTWNGFVCASSSRTSVTVTVTGLLAPTNVTASPTTVACGANTSLNATTTGGYIRWWDAAAAGNFLGSSASGVNFSINPTASTTYYAEAYYNPCNSTRVPVSVTVNPPSTPTVTAVPGIICTGQSSNLIGTYPLGIIRWWNSSTGGTMLGTSASGANFIVFPTSTTVYYAETYAGCGVSTRVADTVTASTLPAPSSLTVTPSSTIACGAQINLGATSASNYINWYTTSTGGTPVGTSETGNTLPLIPLATTTYYAEAANGTPTGGQTFSYTGSPQTWTVPSTVSSITVDVRGAQGGSGGNATLWNPGGYGGRIQGTIAVTASQTLYFYVGGYGGDETNTAAGPGGYNGGGAGGNQTTWLGGGGGGGSDIRSGGNALANRIFVGGGGGGGGDNTNTANQENGGIGGATTSAAGAGYYMAANTNTTYCGQGGTLTAGGAAGTNCMGTASGIGIGGNVCSGNSGGGGAGGYYGGGCGSHAGGGGGSNYSDASATGVNSTPGYQTGNGQIIISYTSVFCISATRSSITITVNPPAAPTTSAVPALVCPGSISSFIGVTPIGIIRWWTSPTGGTMLSSTISGASFNISPTAATIYYAETYATCGTSTRTGDTVLISTPLSVPTMVTATPTTLNCGIGSATLSGTTSSQSIAWYDASSGGNLIGNTVSNGSLTVYPVSTIVYYAESQNLYSGSQTYSYTGSQQTFTVPTGIVSVTADVQGGAGGTYSGSYGVGGYGGRVKANISVMPGQQFYLNVGGQGTWSTTSPYGAGWNGGGAGGYSSYYGGGGGGASDIRSGGTALGNRIIVAGGGGGACGYTGYYNGNGGVGGDQTGGYGLYYGSYYTSYCGMGGSQTAGGLGGTSGGTAGSLGTGGAAYTTYGGGGGGGGYYGGGGGYYYGGGGGGSNYYSTTGISNVVTYQGYSSGNGQIIISWNAISCSSVLRVSVTVNVNSSSSQPSYVTATPSIITCGDVSSLNAISAGYTIGWFNVLSGGSRICTTASGVNYLVSPTQTTTYYAEAESIVSGSLTFSYSGTVQSWSVPINTSYIIADVQGAQGGTYNSTYGSGGLGGRVQATIPVTPGQQLYFNVGQQGTYYTVYTGTPSFNGGGMGAWSYYYGGGGGGSSDIRTVSGSLSSILAIAGGGGGGNGYSGYTNGNGGDGGGLTAGNGLYSGAYNSSYSGAGGTQTGGGIGGGSYGGPGIPGVGGNAYYYYGGGGGGGGYYGGGGGYEYGGGGGGSSWASSSCSSVTHTQGYTTGNGQIIISWNFIQCASTRTPVTLTVHPPANPTNVGSLPSTISCGGFTNLSATDSVGVIRWWSASSGGTLLGSSISGSNFAIYPPGATTTYYAESYTTCSSPQRIADTVYFSTTIGPIAYASPSSICTGAISNLVGIAPGNLIRWFDSPYGGALIATEQSGSSFTITPTTSTSYYAEGYIGSTGTLTFNYTTSSYITWTVPLGAMSVSIDASGAQGGNYGSSVSYGSGGLGGRVQTVLNTIPGQTLYIYVGQQGQPNTTYLSTYAGGWWGGGSGGSLNSAGGGGGTDIRIGGTSTSNRVIVAGAGGGNCGYSTGINSGGAGGGLTGGNGLYSSSYNMTYCGGGGTQTSGGLAATYSTYAATTGILGKGGSQTSSYGGGGGGGYYGGGAGSYYGGGGGGSSWTDPSYTSYTTHTQGYQTGNGQLTISWNVAPCTGGRTEVDVNIDTPTDPTGVTCTPTSISCGSAISLNATTNGFYATWWDSPSGGNYLGNSLSGSNFNIIPTGSTTYYVESDAFSIVTHTYGYTGMVQTLIVPTGVNGINVDAGGAQGSAYDTTIGMGGLGGRVQTVLSVSAGQVLYLSVGGQGPGTLLSAGWNGGACGSGCSTLKGGSGGGATDIRVGGISLSNRVLVAGGGGGGGYGSSLILCNGGSGGSTVGGNGLYNGAYNSSYCGSGGTQTSGGLNPPGYGQPGTLGNGGSSSSYAGEGGGGGGYYGGGGAYNSGGGGGGSSWSDPNVTTNTVHTQGYQRGNGILILSWNSILCNSADRISVSVLVTPISNPVNVMSSPATINCSSGTNLSANTTVGVIRWWSSSTGGTLYGSTISGGSLSLYPSTTTVYYAETYQSPCVSTNRVSLTVTVLPITSPTATATPSSYCISGTSNLNGISPGNTITWWPVATGGTALGTSSSGNNFSVSPTITTTYYADATQYGTPTCISNRVPVTVTVNVNSTPATSATGTPSAICPGTTTILSLTGGNLSSGANWYWYKSACGGSVSTVGSSITVSPAVTTTYYVRGQGTCNTTTCVSTAITLNTNSVTSDSVSLIPGIICIGSGTSLSRNGGSLGTGARWSWYTGSCGGTLLGTGVTFTTFPSSGMTYYLRAEGTCNTTICKTKTIIVNTNSVIGTSATITPSSVCSGGTITLGLTGGQLGTGGNWYWYTGSCGGTLLGFGNNFNDNPLINTTYYVRGEGTCNTTNCISKTLILNTNSTAATSASGLPSSICTGSSSSITLTGGSLGIGSSWKWYSSTCGGLYEGNGTILTVSPTITTVYYVRAENACNTTICVSNEIDVNINSVSGISASAFLPTICANGSTTLSVTGGITGTGGDWFWYSGSCAGSFAGNGSTLILSPPLTTIYYVRGECICNTTGCISVGVIVQTNSTVVDSVTASLSTICEGGTTTIVVNGGLLGTSADWYWYSGICGGSIVGNGSSLTVFPTITTDYYVRGEGVCNTTQCKDKIVTVNDSSVISSSVTVSNDTICSGLTTTLGLAGGTLGTSSNWYWYKGSCGGTLVGNGMSVIINPATTTVYYVRAEGLCNTTGCINKMVTVNDTSTTISSVLSSTISTICIGGSTTLNVTGGILGTGSDWHWYSVSCGIGGIGVGSSVVNSPNISTTYYIRAEGICNTTSCMSIFITVNTNSTGPITGISSPDTICYGGSTNLIIMGGQLGTGGNWYWYSGGCGITNEGIGTQVISTPSLTMSYYVRGEGTCNTTGCISVGVLVKTNTVIATGLTSTTSSICESGSTNLGITGGILGTGANWYWYSIACGLTQEGNGTGITVNPTITTTYYLRGEGICNTTTCSSIIITVNDSSNTATTAMCSPDTVCSGLPTTLILTGGQLGTGGNWYWYGITCGGVFEGFGSQISVIPTITIDYYVRAEGLCNTTNCIHVHETVKSNSTSVSSITSSSTTICESSSTNLGITGGILGTGGNWYWYIGTCGLTQEGNGTGITVVPTITTTYYVRGEGVCNSTVCKSMTITVNDSSIKAVSITAMSDTICYGSSTILGVTGGFTGTGALWQWYSGACGGTPEGNGSIITISPTVTTSYYLRAEGLCNTTGCINTTITVNSISINTTVLTAVESTICSGSSTTLGLTGGTLGTGGDWYWYSGICGGTQLGNGLTQVITATITGQYYVRGEGTCNTTLCTSITINVLLLPVSPNGITTDRNGICSDAGGNINLSITGGYGDIFEWYTVGCGQTSVGSGVTLTLPAPVVTTIYYGNWETISCGNSMCLSIELTVIPKPIDPQTAGATPDTIGTGQSTILNVSGNLSTGELWSWYENNCGAGSILGTGTNIEIYPQSTTVYYVRSENGVCYSNCISTILIIPGSLNNAGSMTTIPGDTICSGDSTVLGVSNVLNGGMWYWYESSCGGIFLGTGITIVVSPITTTTYSVRQELGGLQSSCESNVLYVNTLSTISSGTVTTTNSTICEGGTTTIIFTGGILGTGAHWYWYSGSCGGSLEGNGNSITVSPTITTGYYIRGEGTCNTTTCLNVNITVKDSSTTSSTSVSAVLSAICVGDITTISISGGILGSGANWYWYRGSCGVTQEGNGNTINVGPTTTTVYYVRAEGTCNTTVCKNVNITVNLNSVSANSVTSVFTTICEGNSTTISVTGGNLGTGGNWYWYSLSCGGTAEGNGSTQVLSPTGTTVYYVRAEGICNTTSCASVNITVNTNTISPVSVTAQPGTIVNGSGSTLTSNGGILGTGGGWYWYNGTCGGTQTGNGDSLMVSPTATTIYYIRGEGTCNTTICSSITITVNDTSISAGSITATTVIICSGDSSTLGINGGLLGTGANWYWYSLTCGGLMEGIGSTITVKPTILTEYYVRAEGVANTTGCVSMTIMLNSNSIVPTAIITAKDTIHMGDTDTLLISGGLLGTSAIWNWYTGGCGVTIAGTGISILISPTLTTVYYIGAVGLCNTTTCISEEITVIQGYSISGTLKYDNQSGTLMDSVWMYLSLNGNIIDSTRSDTNGIYRFNLIPSGTYTITGKTGKPWGGVNSTDAVKVKRHFAGSEYLTTSLRLHAADVNMSMGINTTDAVKITRRFVGSDTLFTRGDWDFEKPTGGDTINVSPTINDTVVVNGSNLIQDFRGICIGDVNGSNVPPPGAKSTSKLTLNLNEVMELKSGEYFELPLRVTNAIDVGAISMILNYPKELVTIDKVQFSMNNEKIIINNGGSNLIYNISGDEMRVGWFESDKVLSLKESEPILIISGETTNNFKTGDVIKFSIKKDVLCELADEKGEVEENVVLNTYSIEYKNTINVGATGEDGENELSIYPNPAKDKMNINYSTVKDGRVKIELYNILGEKIEDIIDLPLLKGKYTKEIEITTLSSGVYTFKMILGDKSFIVKRLVVSK